MERMNLRQAAERCTRSITTLRRYIRSGKLRAEKREGRFGPEYFVTADDLAAAGLELDSGTRSTAIARRKSSGGESPLHASVPIVLFQELQMKHEQLLVQYGMVRAGGMRVFQLQAELDDKHRSLVEAQEHVARLKREMVQETARLRSMVREAELEQEGRGLEIAALTEKVRALEMLTRNARTSDSIERQFREMMDQSQRVDRLKSELPGRDAIEAELRGRIKRAVTEARTR